MDGSLILELLPIPDIVSDGFMVVELHQLTHGRNDGDEDNANTFQTGDLYVASFVFFILSILVNVVRLGWKIHMERKNRTNLTSVSHHYAQFLRNTYFLTSLLEDIPQFIITIIYINRQLSANPETFLTFAQQFSLIASMGTLFTCGLTQEYLNNCTKYSVRDDACIHVDLYLIALFYTIFYWIYWMLPAAITTLLSSAILAQYPLVRTLSWVLVGLWTPSAIYMCVFRREDNNCRYCFNCNELGSRGAMKSALGAY